VEAEMFARGGSLCEGTWGQYLCVQGGDAVSGVGSEDRKTRLVHWWVLRVSQARAEPMGYYRTLVRRDPGGK
jgi:hypothetical protein